jgi:hypothetical protein
MSRTSRGPLKTPKLVLGQKDLILKFDFGMYVKHTKNLKLNMIIMK